MLSLLHNNFVIASVVSLILVGFIVSQNRNKEERPGLVFYMRCFALCFILLIVVLYFKTGDLSLPSMKQSCGGYIPFNPTSVSNVPVSPPRPTATLDSIGRELGLHNVNLESPSF